MASQTVLAGMKFSITGTQNYHGHTLQDIFGHFYIINLPSTIYQ